MCNPRNRWIGYGVCICIALFLGNGIGFCMGVSQNPPGEEDELVPMKIVRVGMETVSGQYVVILADVRETRALVIWIGPFEANAIGSEMRGEVHRRPLTHDLLGNIIQEGGFTIQRVVITHLAEGTYHATMVMKKRGEEMEVDARPSDSLVMALKFQAPIFAAESLLKEKAVALQEEERVERKYGFLLQELTIALARAFSFPSERAVLVSDVLKGSAAETSGFKRGDILVEVSGTAVEDVLSARKELNSVSGSVWVKIFRQGAYMELKLPAIETE